MKKLLSSVSKSALILCLTLQVAHAMDSEERKTECSDSRPKVSKPKNKNKEQYNLLKENFSTEADINFTELYKHIHYIFKNKDLLLDALHPLLSGTLQRPKKNFEHLEFLGDSVLSVITRERIITLFPDEERGMHTKLYDALICNKTLAEAYQQNLDIELYLPYPGAQECQYCNVVEAIIGAIYRDNSNNELAQPRKFMLRILDDHLFIQKRKELLEKKEIKLKSDDSNVKISFVLPNIKKIINEVLEDSNTDQKNTKSLLAIILGKTLQDQPTYTLSLGKNAEHLPVFIANVIGSQIGHRISGIGFTKDEAERNAAQNAINFLAQEDRILQKRLNTDKQTHIKFINEYCQTQKLKLSYKEHTLVRNFTCQVKIGDTTIGEGIGISKVTAREEAAYKACEYLNKKQEVNFQKKINKKYTTMLQELESQKKITNVKFIEIKGSQNIVLFKFQIMIDKAIISEGTGSTKTEAKENAAHKAYIYLIENGKDEYKNLKSDKKYKSILEEWASQKKISDCTFIETKGSQPIVEFQFQVKVDQDIIGEGAGSSKEEAKENAAQKACTYLIENQKIENLDLKIDKKHSSILQEWVSQNKISDYQLIERSSPSILKLQVMIGEDIVGEGEGFLEKAKEDACRSAFDQLLKKQEETRKHKEIRKISAKKIKEVPAPTLNFCISNPIIVHDSSSGRELENLVEPRKKLPIVQKEKVFPVVPSINSNMITLERKSSEKAKRKRKKKPVQQRIAIETPPAKKNTPQQKVQQQKNR